MHYFFFNAGDHAYGSEPPDSVIPLSIHGPTTNTFPQFLRPFNGSKAHSWQHTSAAATPVQLQAAQQSPTAATQPRQLKEAEAAASKLKQLLKTLTSVHMNQPVILIVSLGVNFMMMSTILICMMPAQGGGGGGNASRQPPSWGPEMENRGDHSYTFRHWTRDLLLWTVANGDLEPHRQAAMILMQLRGAAQSLTREIPMDIILNGGIINGVQVDPPTYILNVLSERYAQLGEETRLKAMTDLMMFHKRGHERIDDLLTRFDVLRQRAVGQGGVAMSVEGLSWLLLRACQPNDQQLLMLLQDFRGRYPANEAELRQLYTSLRRMGHILEDNPDNIAKQLRTGTGSNVHAFMMSQSQSWGGYAPQQNQQPNYQQQGYQQQNQSWGNWDNNWQSTQQAYPSVGWGSGSGAPLPVNDTAMYPAYQDQNIDSETDTETVSSVGNNVYDHSDIPEELGANQRAEALYWAPIITSGDRYCRV